MNGLLILDKPAGFTSFDVIAVMRKLTGEKKIGHTGTLDPMATGVLPLLFGRAAKAADLLPDTDKAYCAAFRVGIKTDTGDITGKIVEQNESVPEQEQWEAALAGFRGEIKQIPPMYSAVSVGGKRLYDLARQGIEIEREARPAHIGRLVLSQYDIESGTGVLEVACSKGTYIRTLIEDIAASLGTAATMTALRRTAACGFAEAQSITLEKARTLAQTGELTAYIQPVENLFAHLPAVEVSAAQATRFQNGGELALDRLKLPVQAADGQAFRIYAPLEDFLGLGKASLQKNEMQILKLFKLC